MEHKSPTKSHRKRFKTMEWWIINRSVYLALNQHDLIAERNRKRTKEEETKKGEEREAEEIALKVWELLECNAVQCNVTLKPLCCLLHHQRFQLLHNRSVLTDSLHEKRKGQKSLFPSSFKRNEWISVQNNKPTLKRLLLLCYVFNF